MPYKPSDPYVKVFTTSSPTTGAAANADSLPVATPNKNGTDDGAFTLTVTNIDTGRYKITGTIPSGYARGDVVNVSVAATCGGVAGKSVVDTFVMDSKRVGDLNDAVTAPTTGAIATAVAAAIPPVTLASNAFDSIVIEAGLNARQALSLHAAFGAGVLSGAGTGTITIKGAGVGANRIVATTDTAGNRQALTLTPPA